jgi:hypothetical protein
MILDWFLSKFKKSEPRLCPVCDTVLVYADGWLCWHQEKTDHMFIDRGKNGYILRYLRGPLEFFGGWRVDHYQVDGWNGHCVASKRRNLATLPIVEWEIDAPTVPGLDPKKPEWLIEKLDAMEKEQTQ